ncbi:MAG: GTP cyclohydrolase II [Spiribacter sp.]|nr:GTP cyclohydrolase II [Spiribacter sp.]
MQRIRRALIDLRRGEPVLVTGEGGCRLVIAVENLNEERLGVIRSLTTEPVALLITGHRARALGMDRPEDDAVTLSLGRLETGAPLEALMAAMKNPTGLDAADTVLAAEYAAIEMTRHAGLMPALVAIAADPGNRQMRDQIDTGEILCVDAPDIAALAPGSLNTPERISEAHVPLEDAESSRFIVYRERDGLLEHVAVLIGEPETWPGIPALRMHSACLTGDLFGSLRCDCGEQLRSAAATIAEEGGGILLYLAQEGRGIGLANKLRAYGLQDTGLDTVDADQLLGFGEDERRYEAAAAMLGDLDIRQVRLMTNNPAKIAALEAAGIQIAGREALHGRLNSHNVRYLTAKADRAGHWLEEVLADGRPDGRA